MRTSGRSRGHSVRLPANGLVLVAGANNAGKSALLSALDVVAGVGSDVQALRHAGSVDPARVAATLTLTAGERSALFAANPRRAEFLHTGVASRLQLVFEEQPKLQPGTKDLSLPSKRCSRRACRNPRPEGDLGCAGRAAYRNRIDDLRITSARAAFPPTSTHIHRSADGHTVCAGQTFVRDTSGRWRN